ncbi:LysM peptidoglycan-binding domain-containing M23 family metallopeptidase [Pseudooceanicola aestuarii]|uniref:LysM peptidoglycan-binding domain-containing M23 family metallopeptidase n=1 Tax=Pseudooceanicola aestuarii TaxID=2697319 RepID=UPI0030844675
MTQTRPLIAPAGRDRHRSARLIAAASALALLAACGDQTLDTDIRGAFGGFNTSDAARNATAARPSPDDRGIISYPSYQVAVARRGDSLADVAARIGTDVTDLARYNGLRPDDALRSGEIIALPGRVAEPSPATGAAGMGPILNPEGVDIASMAGTAIDRAEDNRVAVATVPPSNPGEPNRLVGREPIQHKVARGETAYTIARLYGVSVRALADWNGLDRNFTIREGQFLLIPLASTATAPRSSAAAAEVQTTELPGTGSPTPVPPSAAKPLPDEQPQPLRPQASSDGTSGNSAQAAAEPQIAPDLSSEQTPTSSKARMSYPVRGNIIRTFQRGKSDGIDIAAASGTGVSSAAAGTVAAVTSDNVIVVRHDGNLVTIYSNLDSISVTKGQSVARGAPLAKVTSDGSPYLHFEVRQGMTAVDPADFLD